MSRMAVAALAAVSLVFLLGCDAGLESRGFQTRVIPRSNPDEVFASAQAVLRREFPRLTVDRAARQVVSEPVEYTTRNESGTTRDFYRGNSTMRRIATLTVTPRGDGAIARLRIERQRQDTERREVQPPSNRLSDSPAETPIERDAAIRPEQNTVWTSVGRDNRLERSLLGELEQQFAKEEPSSAPPQ